jgi:hypothetical protein
MGSGLDRATRESNAEKTAVFAQALAAPGYCAGFIAEHSDVTTAHLTTCIVTHSHFTHTSLTRPLIRSRTRSPTPSIPQAMLDASAGNVNSKLVEAAHQMTETIASLEDRCEVLEKMVVGETDLPLHSTQTTAPCLRAHACSLSLSLCIWPSAPTQIGRIRRFSQRATNPHRVQVCSFLGPPPPPTTHTHGGTMPLCTSSNHHARSLTL